MHTGLKYHILAKLHQIKIWALILREDHAHRDHTDQVNQVIVFNVRGELT